MYVFKTIMETQKGQSEPGVHVHQIENTVELFDVTKRGIATGLT